MKVFKDPCKNCLLSEHSIVSPKRRKEIIQVCAQRQTYFICHKAKMEGDDIVCSTFYKRLGHVSQMIRISERLNCIKMIDQPDSKKLPTHNEMNRKTKN